MVALRYWLSTTAPSCSNSTLTMPSQPVGMVNSTTLVCMAVDSFSLPLTVKLIRVPPLTTVFGSMSWPTTVPAGSKLYGS